MPDDGRFSTLNMLLKKFQPHILFLSGHGSFHHAPHTGEAPYGTFLFESESGVGEPVREDKIAQALIGSGVQVVVLSACEPARRPRRLTLDSRKFVRWACRCDRDAQSIWIWRGFNLRRCGELAQHERIDSALQTARAAIQKPLKDIARREAELTSSAELSFGQWCLPMLLSPSPQQALIDWDFEPQQIKTRSVNKSLSTISLPERFVGRRTEMRQYKNELLNGKIQKLLITGPGGQGKTSLAGKLAFDMEARGYKVLAWSARTENSWREFEYDMQDALDLTRAASFDRAKGRYQEQTAKLAETMFSLLMEQYSGQVLLFLDNLESIQDQATREITDETFPVWMPRRGPPA